MKNVADIYPLSAVQLGMLFHTLAQETSDNSGVYVNQYTCELKGTLQVDLFQQAWQQTIDRHPVLRTAFLWEGLDEPLQVVRQQVNLPWQRLDWRSVEDWEARLNALLKSDRALGFNLAKAPLIRLTFIQRHDTVAQLVWTAHHMLFDGWSLPLIWQDMLAFYQALRKGTTAQLETVRPYRDYIAWQKEQLSDLLEQFWRSQLQGFNEPTPLPAALTVPYEEQQTYQQQTKRLDIAPLKALARAQRLTLNTLVQGAWALLLHHYTQENEVMYGSVVSGRPAALSGVEKMVGLFINTLPVRAVIDREQSVANWLQAYQQQLLSGRKYETTALSDLQRWSDLPAGTPLFESIVVFENYPTTAKADLSFTVENARYLEQSNYPLALLVVPAEDLTLILLYDANRFERGAIARLLQHLELLFTAFVEQPNATLSHLPRLTPIEQTQLSQPPQPNEHNLTIQQLIEQQVGRTPQAQAVVFNGQVLTYETLNQQANQLAGELRRRGVTPGSRVALCLNRSVKMVVCILAILKAGAAYIPLDPDYPQSRLAYCIQDSAPQLICTEKSVQLPAVDTPALLLDDILLPQSPPDQISPDNPPTLSQPDDLAYIIYTSGSTGQPKGVMVSHRNLVHSTVARFQVYPDPVRRFLLLSSIAFDSSVAGLFWTLCQGGALVIAPARIEQDLQQLTDLINQEKITHTLCVPTLYDLLIKNADLSQLATLKTVIVAGEACLRSLVKQHYSRLPKTELYNEYGPTEATVWCTAHRISADPPPGPISIGSAIPHTKVYLLDASLRPVPTGAIGEIYVGGAGVTQGYLNQADRTAAAFLNNPFCGSDSPTADNLIYKTGDLARYRADGSLEWLGRVDRQVKIRGYRIELGEIEAVLRSHPTVKETVVVARSLSTAIDSTVTEGIDPSSIESLAKSLAALPPDQADALLSAVEGER